MKIITIAFLCLLFSFSLIGCNASDDFDSESDSGATTDDGSSNETSAEVTAGEFGIPPDVVVALAGYWVAPAVEVASVSSVGDQVDPGYSGAQKDSWAAIPAQSESSLRLLPNGFFHYRSFMK